MAPKLQSCLYIRVDRELRRDLIAAAKSQSLTASEVGRRILRDGLAGTGESRTVDEPQTRKAG